MYQIRCVARMKLGLEVITSIFTETGVNKTGGISKHFFQDIFLESHRYKFHEHAFAAAGKQYVHRPEISVLMSTVIRTDMRRCFKSSPKHICSTRNWPYQVLVCTLTTIEASGRFSNQLKGSTAD